MDVDPPNPNPLLPRPAEGPSTHAIKEPDTSNMMDIDVADNSGLGGDSETESQLETTPSPIRATSLGRSDSGLGVGTGSGRDIREGSMLKADDDAAKYDRGRARVGVPKYEEGLSIFGNKNGAVRGAVDGEGEGEEMRKLMESIELTKKATILQQRLALASFKAQRGWSDLSLKEIEPKLAPLSPSPASPSMHTSASPIRRRRSRANLSQPSPSSFPCDPTAPPVPFLPGVSGGGSGSASGSASPTSSRFTPYGYGSPGNGMNGLGHSTGGAGGGTHTSRSRGRKPNSAVELGNGYPSLGLGNGGHPSSPIRLSFTSPSRNPHHSLGGSSFTSTNSPSRSRDPDQRTAHRRRSSSSTTLVAAIDLSNHGFAHGREGGPRVVSVSVHGSSGGRRIDSGTGSPAGGRRRSGILGAKDDDDGESDLSGERLAKRRRSGPAPISIDLEQGALPPMPRRPSDSLQSRMLGHRRILSSSASSSFVPSSSTDQRQQHQPTPPYGKKFRSQSHSTHRTISGSIVSAVAADGNGLATTDEMDVDAANALTSMLGSGPGNSPLRASFAPQFAKPRSQSFAVGAGPYDSPPRRTPIGLAPAYDDGARPHRSDSAIEEASSDEDKKAAELMIFLAHSPSPIRDRRRDPGHVIPLSMGRVLFEDQLAEKQKVSPQSPEDEGMSMVGGMSALVSPRATEREYRGVSLSATSSMDSVDQPTTPPARHDDRLESGFGK